MYFLVTYLHPSRVVLLQKQPMVLRIKKLSSYLFTGYGSLNKGGLNPHFLNTQTFYAIICTDSPMQTEAHECLNLQDAAL